MSTADKAASPVPSMRLVLADALRHLALQAIQRESLTVVDIADLWSLLPSITSAWLSNEKWPLDLALDFGEDLGVTLDDLRNYLATPGEGSKYSPLAPMEITPDRAAVLDRLWLTDDSTRDNTDRPVSS